MHIQLRDIIDIWLAPQVAVVLRLPSTTKHERMHHSRRFVEFGVQSSQCPVLDLTDKLDLYRLWTPRRPVPISAPRHSTLFRSKVHVRGENIVSL